MASDREIALSNVLGNLYAARQATKSGDLEPEDRHAVLGLADIITDLEVLFDQARQDRLADAAWYRRQSDPRVRGLSHIDAAE